MPSTPVSIALLGSGFAAKAFHAPYILALPDVWKLVGAVERTGSKNQGRARERFGSEIRIYASIDDVLQDDTVESVCVCTPGHLHFEHSKAALLAKKHIIVEKPFCNSLQEVQELMQLAEQNGRMIIPYQNRRFDGDFLTVQKLLRDKTIPAVIDFESRYDCNVRWPMGDPASTAGITYGLGSHTIDQAVLLFGRPASVYADLFEGRGIGNPEVDDSANIILRYKDSKLRVMLRIATFSVMKNQLRFIVRGPGVAYVKYGIDVQEPQINAGMEPLDERFGYESENQYGELHTALPPDPASGYIDAESKKITSERGNYLQYYRAAGHAIRGEGDTPVRTEDVATQLEIIEAAFQSSRTGQVVAL